MVKKFMWDPGHDLYTPGKGVAGMKEFEFNRGVVEEALKLMAEYEGVECQVSHNLYDGVDDSLSARADRANDWGATCLISVHANAAGSTQANGIETFTHINAPAGTVNLAAEIHGEIIRETGMNNRGLKKADFAVLRETKMDAALIEYGFMTNPGDLAKLKSQEYRAKCAKATVAGLVKHYKLVKKAVKPINTVKTSAFTDKVTIPNTAFWQSQALVNEYQKRGFKCYLIPLKPYEDQENNNPCPFVVETDYSRANLVNMELRKKGYTQAVWEAL